MSFADPIFLIALLLVPLAVLAQVLAVRRARRHAVRFTAIPALKLAVGAVPAWRRHLPAALAVAALTTLALALAKPQRSVAVPLERASIMLVTDHSRSMLATDVEPDRLAAGKGRRPQLPGRGPAPRARGGRDLLRHTRRRARPEHGARSRCAT